MIRRRGFTLIELLVVVGMIMALAAILLPAIHRAYVAAERSRMAADLQVIGNALEAYRNDFGDYPQPGISPNKLPPPAGSTTPVSVLTSGPITLCWALVAPGRSSEDGADGPGFRIRGSTGTVYGPYIPADRFMIGTLGKHYEDTATVTPWSDHDTASYSSWFSVLADRRGRVILYYPAGKRARPGGAADSYVPGMWSPAATPSDPVGLLPSWVFMKMVGADPKGAVAPGKTPIIAPYLLISAGTAPVLTRAPKGQVSLAQAQPTPFGLAENVANVELYPVPPRASPGK